MKLKEFNVKDIEVIIKESNSFSEVLRKLNLSKSGAMVNQLRNYLNENNISFDHFGKSAGRKIRTVNNIFIENSDVDQKTLRKWYLEGKYSEYKCSICGMLPI